MRGGIQPGTTAWDKKSLRHDRRVRVASQRAYDLLKKKYPGIVKYKKLPRQYIPGGVGACAPDGGIWFYNGCLLAAFEAKKQGDQGNAIERWYKNQYLIEKVNSRCPLVTYAVGEGVREGYSIHRILYVAHLGDYNIFRDDGPSCFMKEGGFTLDELKKNMISFIESEIRRSQTL